MISSPVICPAQRVYQNREIQDLFGRYRTAKSFIARDQLRETSSSSKPTSRQHLVQKPNLRDPAARMNSHFGITHVCGFEGVPVYFSESAS